jgi:hypothetical protein
MQTGVFDRVDSGLRGWHVALLWVIALTVGAFLGFVTGPRLMELSGDVAIFDVRFTGYGHDDAVAILTALGEEGRRYYRNVQLIVDFLFPPLLFLAVASAFLYFSRSFGRFSLPLPEGFRLMVVALALIGGVCDLGENLSVLAMLLGDGEPTEALVNLGSMFTMVKSAALTLAIAATAVTIVLALIRGLFSRQARAA